MPGKDRPFPYEDIVSLSRPAVSRPLRLSQEDRAAQFAPFAALTGHEALLGETARRTEEQAELAPDAETILDEKLRRLNSIQREHPRITVTWFEPDLRKSGGAYLTVTRQLLAVDGRRQKLLLGDGTKIGFDRIYEISIEEKEST